MSLEEEIKSKAEIIAKSLEKGKDVEIRRSKDGITIAELGKKVISR